MPKPLIFTDTRPDVEKFDPQSVEGMDPSYVPGFSEQVRANDLAKADDFTFREFMKQSRTPGKTKEQFYAEIGARPAPITAELRWLRVTAPNGANSTAADIQLARERARGFRLATEEDLLQHGYGIPPAAHKTEDGSFRRHDVALFIRDGEVARKWEAYEAEQAKEFEKPPLMLDAQGISAPIMVEHETEIIHRSE